MHDKVFSPALFAPVQYYAHLVSANKAWIECYCNYSRQTYRNRFIINGANGAITLVAPVVKKSGAKTLTRDTRVSYDTPWNLLAWKSIEAAYNSSPYFIYYKDDIEPIFRKRWDFLIDLDMASLMVTMECAAIDTEIKLTGAYHSSYTGMHDLRDVITPKTGSSRDNSFSAVPYRQVFQPAGEFIPDLSILDLLFNKGPESLLVLRDCYAGSETTRGEN